jgi:aubergine
MNAESWKKELRNRLNSDV